MPARVHHPVAGPLSRPRVPLAPSPASGLLLALALAAAAWLAAAAAAQSGVSVSPVLLALLGGMLLRQCTSLPDRAAPGLCLARNQVLKAGIVLMGMGVSAASLRSVGMAALPVVLACITAALVGAAILWRVAGAGGRLGILIAVGTSVCGCTAVMAVAAAVRARAAETGYAIACVTLFGTAGMLLYPLVADLLYAGRPGAAGVFLGTAIHDTSQVIGAAMLYEQAHPGSGSLEAATVTKLLRNLSILLIVPALACHFRDDSDRGARRDGTRLQVARLVPWFVVGFIAMSMVRTYGDAMTVSSPAAIAAGWQAAVDGVRGISLLLLLMAMAACGLGIRVDGVRRLGLRPLIAAAGIALLVAVTSLAMIALTGVAAR